ncbi:MAG: lumazine-binding protein [Mycobacteriaceae bacterium]|nr:lumazine-binding protein [Mycobacteriaceae bacterium]
MNVPEPDSEPEPSADRPSAAPFLGALAIISIVVIAIALVNFFQGDELSPEQQIVRAAVAQNDALQKESYGDFRSNTCRSEQGTEAEVLADQRDSKEKQGTRRIADVTDVVVNGDRATAKVSYQFDKASDVTTDVETTFVLEDGAWKVCTQGPS